MALSMSLLGASVSTTGSAVYMEYGAVGVSLPLHQKNYCEVATHFGGFWTS